MKKSTVLITLISAIGGAVIGGGVTYLTLKKHFKEQADAEIAEVRRYYALIRKDDKTISIMGSELESDETSDDEESEGHPGTAEEYSKAKDLLGRLGYNVPVSDAESKSVGIFDLAVPDSDVGPQLTGPNGEPIIVGEGSDDTDVDYDPNDPMAHYVRISGQPYIISVDEFFNSEEEWEKNSLSYYEGDDVLIDEAEKEVDDRDRYIGDRHLDMFGVLSGDKKVVYVRNPQISADFEIILEKGKYTVRVLGEDDHDEEPKRPLRRMRDSD